MDAAGSATGITQWLAQARDGDTAAMQQVFATVYSELRRMAHRQLGGAARTLDTTGLVHECYVRLVGREAPARDRGHFFALAARVMRQVIVDYARERLAAKRGGGERGETLDDDEVAEQRDAEQLVEVGDLLEQLSTYDQRLARVVECRFFAGLSEIETAEALGISERSVQRDWHEAREWLRRASQPVGG